MAKDNHLRSECIFGYKRGLLTSSELRDLDAHVALCADCRERLANAMDVDLESASTSLRNALEKGGPQTASRPFTRYAVAAGIAIAAALGAWFTTLRHAAPAHDGAAAVAAQQQQIVEGALRSGRIQLPEFMAELRPKREVLMGSPTQARMELISPAGTVVITDRPEFHWTPLPGKWTYRVRIYSPGFQAVAESPDVSNPVWRPGSGLPSGVKLEWKLPPRAANSGSPFLSHPCCHPDSASRTPLRSPGFSSSSSSRESRISCWEFVYGESGMLDEARRELAEAVRAQPNSRDLTRLLDSLNVRP